MGCAPSGNHKSKSGGAMKEVKFENMKMQDVDSYFESIQEILNLFIKFSEPLNEAKTNLFERTGFNKEKNPSNFFSLISTVMKDALLGMLLFFHASVNVRYVIYFSRKESKLK